MKIIKSVTSFVGVAAIWAMFSGPVFGQENPKLSDAEVAFIAVVANQIDINYADIAKERSKNADIVKFAETMISDHEAVIAQATALVKKLGITPKENAVAKKLLAD